MFYIWRHINNVFAEKELVRDTNVHFMHVASADKPVAFYTLDVIISVGYRVKSQRGVEFRRWATDVLHRYIVDGSAQNEQRLRQLGLAVSIIARLPEGDVSTRQVLEIVQSYSQALDLFKNDIECAQIPLTVNNAFSTGLLSEGAYHTQDKESP